MDTSLENTGLEATRGHNDVNVGTHQGHQEAIAVWGDWKPLSSAFTPL